jgi:hypothetical protein
MPDQTPFAGNDRFTSVVAMMELLAFPALGITERE